MTKRNIHWPRSTFFGVTIAVTMGFGLLSEPFSLGGRYMIQTVFAILLVLLAIAVLTVNHRTTRVLAFVIISLLGAEMAGSLFVLIRELLLHQVDATKLLLNGVVLWLTNIVLFSVWYWEIDRGGPYRRHHHLEAKADFYFPQMGMNDQAAFSRWHPIYMDYLFLAFTASTAFSPTDTLPLTARAKAMLMVQALISLMILAIVAARAVNIA